MNGVCQQCGAELLPQTSFCRQCGAAVSSIQPEVGSERPTRLLDQPDVAATQRFDPRPTQPGREALHLPPQSPAVSARHGSNKVILLTVVMLVLLAGIISTLAVIKNRPGRSVVSVDALTYPGARKTMDIVAGGGGHTIALETADPFDEVQDWYRRTLQPEKVVQLTSASIVMKNEKTTATIVREGGKTSILLKTEP
ncbi:MAG TPA: zinc ribbon domain-containing protein [Pyrinomonadaceae bacterium]|nr:zinc ribbon domain-containing protein [Pyrinomonadaceae bacterium]